MDFHTFASLAARTEAPITDAVIDRMASQIYSIRQAFWTLVMAGKMMDDIKKYVFYNRGSQPPVQPNSEIEAQFLKQVKNNPAEADYLGRSIHGMVGIFTELAEYAEEFFTSIEEERPADFTNLGEELFDINWYLPMMAEAMRTNMDDLAVRGFSKLRIRYDDKFNENDADVRDLEAERRALKGEGVGEPLGVKFPASEMPTPINKTTSLRNEWRELPMQLQCLQPGIEAPSVDEQTKLALITGIQIMLTRSIDTERLVSICEFVLKNRTQSLNEAKAAAMPTKAKHVDSRFEPTPITDEELFDEEEHPTPPARPAKKIYPPVAQRKQ